MPKTVIYSIRTFNNSNIMTFKKNYCEKLFATESCEPMKKFKNHLSYSTLDRGCVQIHVRGHGGGLASITWWKKSLHDGGSSLHYIAKENHYMRGGQDFDHYRLSPEAKKWTFWSFLPLKWVRNPKRIRLRRHKYLKMFVCGATPEMYYMK